MDSPPENEDFPGRLAHQAALWDNVELLEDLLQEGGYLVDSLDSWGRTPIHAAAINADSQCLRRLIAAKANLDAQSGPRCDGKTALHMAAEHGHDSNVRALLAANANAMMKDANGLTAYSLAERAGHKQTIKLLRDAGDAREAVRFLKHKELREAITTCDESAVNIFLDALGVEKEIIVNMAPAGANTLLFVACELGNRTLVELLLGAGADGRAHPVTQYSPLYTAVYHGHFDIVQLILNKFPELVQFLTVERWLPLHAACINGHYAIVELLFSYPFPASIMTTFQDNQGEYEWKLPFDPNTQDVTGQTALYVACLLGNRQMVDLLLNWKIKCSKISTELDPNTPIVVTSPISPSKRRISFGIQSIMSRLSLGRDPAEDSPTEFYRSPLKLNLLCGAARETALLAAVRGGYYDVVRLLLKHGSNPNTLAKPIEDQNDPRSTDEIYGFSSVPLSEATKQRSLPLVQLLLEYGAKDEQSSALTIACANGDEQILCKLLAMRAHIDPEYKINKKALNTDVDLSSTGNNVTYSALFPNTPTMINWHNNCCQLNEIKVQWIAEAVLQYNSKLRDHPRCRVLALDALTRLDISHNRITNLPPEIFSMSSLRYLNLAQNNLEKLPLPEDLSKISPSYGGVSRSSRNIVKDYNCPVLEELYVQDNRLESIPAALFRLPALLTLDVSNNKMQELPFDMWRSPKLRELNVAFNLLKDLPVLPTEVYMQISEPPSPVSEAYLFSQALHENSTSNQRNRIVTQLELVRHHIWTQSLEVTDQELFLPETSFDDVVSQIVTLNLANNLFTSIPLALPCLAVNLTRLNMAYNSLRSMGHVTSYPASLKQLDLGHNEITCWPSLPRIALLDPHLACYNPQETKVFKASNVPLANDVAVMKTSQSPGGATSLRSVILKSVCSHRRHLRLESLRTLVLADNLFTRIQLSTDDVTTLNDGDDSEWSLVGVAKSRIIFPNLSMLDISNNCLREIPHSIHELNNLSVLNLSGNVDIVDLPPHMGLLSRLWNLNTRGCSLQEPLRSMIDSKKYKTMDIIGFLKSVYEDAKPYARMKLMVVGVQGIGKTTILDLLKQDGAGRNRRPVDHWAKRMGHKNINSKTSRGVNMSTVGVDIGDWVCEKKVTRNQSAHGPVLFRTWDFGGQKEYYATHQYFLSKRSLYLVLWRITDGNRGLAEVLQWLGNIQARAPNSPVIIVGTHYDSIGDLYPAKRAEQLQQIIRERFIAVADAEKMGLPKVLDSIEVSCKTGHNIKLLSNLIYDSAFSLRSPGSKEPLLHQRVPASYLALEDVVCNISIMLRQAGADPVLNADRYKRMVTQEMQNRGYKRFRDSSELNQGTMFLHDNGVILHYDDATLRDMYFLDPQWLCDMLAHVVTVREINPFARTGVMKLDDLQHVFKGSPLNANDNRGYIVSLLNKFEVALTWDARTLLIPSLLPADEDLRPGHSVAIKITSRARGWSRSSKMQEKVQSPVGFAHMATAALPEHLIDLTTIGRPDRAICRLLLMSYFPSGFWSRLITRVLADDQVVEAVRNIYPCSAEIAEDSELLQFLSTCTQWNVWQTGIALFYGTVLVFKMREIPLLCPQSPYRQPSNKFKLKQDGVWCDLDMVSTSILEICFPFSSIIVRKQTQDGDESAGDGFSQHEIDANVQSVAHLVALVVDHIDILLEDWYPTLGTRFVHTSEGRFLVTRLVPCFKCLRKNDDRSTDVGRGGPATITRTLFDRSGTGGGGRELKKMSFDGGEASGGASGASGVGLNEIPGIFQELTERTRKSQDSLGWSDGDSGVGPDSTCSSRNTSIEGHPLVGNVDATFTTNYCWMVEECILAAYDKKYMSCPAHGDIELNTIAPDVMFLDLSECNLINSDDITKGPLLGRGAFGFVFKGTYKTRCSNSIIPVAMKMLQPVAPGHRAKESAIIAYKAALGKWERDPLQHACKAYCTARQELAVLLTLKHLNIVPLVGVCIRPLALVLDLAPQGALDGILRHYRRSGARIGPYCFQSLVLQAARAIEYLHRRRVIYRDLKAENVLVWEFPEPHVKDHPEQLVHIKVADYGISRVTLPSGSKGFGGTEGFMAPEIMRHNGEEEYTEKVDCFSFGMFLYELIALRQPFEGHEAVKECILEGGRPMLSQREAQFPCYCLDLMVLCWDQQPKVRPSASQIVSIASAPEFTHLLDVASLAHNGNVMAAVACPIMNLNDDHLSHELWLPCSNSRIDLLMGSLKGWSQYHRIICPRSSVQGAPPTASQTVVGIKLTSVCVVSMAVWLGDSGGNIYGFNASDCTHMFSYALEPAQPSPVIALVYLEKIKRVAAGLENGRLFLLDSSLVPSSYLFAEGSFVLTELGSGERLFSVCAAWTNDEATCEIWCGETEGAMNVFSLNESVVSEHYSLSHFDVLAANREFNVTLVHASGNFVYTYVSPGCILYQWHVPTKTIENCLDCSKFVPCSESLKSIAIEEHLSPGKCQITAISVLNSDLYIGTAWGCIIIVEKISLRPVTIFRPFEDEVRSIIPLHSTPSSLIPMIITIGRGYRSLISRYTDLANSSTPNTPSMFATDKRTYDTKDAVDRSNFVHALLWRGDNWATS